MLRFTVTTGDKTQKVVECDEPVITIGRAPACTIALADPDVARFVGGQPVRKLVYVPGKLVNVVTG